MVNRTYLASTLGFAFVLAAPRFVLADEPWAECAWRVTPGPARASRDRPDLLRPHVLRREHPDEEPRRHRAHRARALEALAREHARLIYFEPTR